MAALAKYQTPELCTPIPDMGDRLSGYLTAGADLAPGDVVYIDGTTGQVLLSLASSNSIASRFGVGIVPDTYYEDQVVTVYTRARFHYGEAMTPGTRFYISASVAGGLATDIPYAGATPVAYAVNATVIQFFSNNHAVI
jgi:hypothetical protein